MNSSALEKELELKGLLLDAATDSIFLHDLYGNFIYVNERAYKERGYTKQELLAMNLKQLDTPDYVPLIKPRIKELMEKGEIRIESAHIGKNRTAMPVEVHARLIEYQGRKLVLSVARDITGRKRAEEEYKTILSTATNGFWLVDTKGRLLDVNKAYCDILGYSRDELLHMSIQDLEAVEKPEETALHIQRIMKAGWDRFETTHRCKDGRLIEIEVSSNYMPFEGGRFVVFLNDITEKKSLERALAESASLERSKVGTELHDGLGQILTGMAFMCKATEQKLFDKKLPEYNDLKKIKELLNEATKLVKNISNGLIPLGIDPPCLEGALSRLAANTEGIYNVSCKVASFITVPIQDRTLNEQLYFIASEALANAVKHGRAQNISLTLRSGDSISLVIEDDGMGFPEGVNYNKGMGLRIMKYRAGIIGASLEVSSPKSGKTSVSCSLRL